MLITFGLILLLTLVSVQSKNVIISEISENNHFAFEYQSSLDYLSPPLTFIVLQPPYQSESQIFQYQNSSQNKEVLEIETSSSPLNCLPLLVSLNLTSNSIILEASNAVSSKLLYSQCLPPVPKVLAYFIIDSSIDLKSNKELQNSIIKFVTERPLTDSKEKRILQDIKSLNDLIVSLSGCVPCAINQFQYLDSLSSDDLATVYLMLLSYNEILVGSKNYNKLNNACKMDPSIKAATKLLNTKNFQHSDSVCDDFVNSFCGPYDSLIKNSACSIQLKDLITTVLDLSNACYSVYYYYKLDPFDYSYGYYFHYYGIVLNAVNLLIYQFGQGTQTDFSYSTAAGTYGSQIKLSYSKYDCDYFNKNAYLKTCGSCSQYVFEITAVFIKYNGYGDYSFRFIYDDSSYYIYNWCKTFLDENVFTRSCSGVTAYKINLNICKPNVADLNIIYHKYQPKYSLLSTSVVSVSVDAHIFYYYYVKNLNCNSAYTNGTCVSCKSGYLLSSTKKCYLNVENCAKYDDPFSKCSSCNSGYGLSDTYSCFKCSDNCDKCTSLNCIKCKDGYTLASKTCTPCKENCSKCSFSLCLSCIDGYSLHANNTCIKCPTGCSKCGDLYNCTECIEGYVLNSLDTNNIYCIQCNGNCLSCSEDYCYQCKTSYTRNPNKLSECLYCSISNCEECDVNGFCNYCKSGYALNSNKMCVYEGIDGCKIININNDCTACRSGYIESFLLCLSCVTCINCYSNYNCKTCKEASKCLSCNDGYYLDQASSKCLGCVSPCIKCANSLSCLSCQNNQCLSTTDPFTCGKHADCDKCLTDKKCRSCKYSMMIPSDEGCKCIDGFFKGASNSCIKCKEECKTCTNYTSCSDCQASNSYYDSTLGCKCNKGFYQTKEIKYSDACSACQSSCKECENGNGCLVCLASNSTYIQNSGCTCDKGFYQAKEITDPKACVLCGDTCKECQVDNVCSKCTALHSTFSQTLGCVCDQGFYRVKLMNYSDACSPCNVTCKECESESVCSACVALNSSFISQVGCVCDKGFYKAKEMSYLDACQACNQTCQECKEQNVCSVCKALNSTHLSGSGCLCNKGFYQAAEMDNIDACMPCKDTCKECAEENICSVCTALNSTFMPGIGCVCDEGYYQSIEMNNSDACKPCNSTCKACENDYECLTCQALNSTFSPNVGCVCDEGFYQLTEMNTLNACMACNNTCKKCNEENVCSICTALNSTFISGIGCVCDQGFYQLSEMNNSDACFPCNNTCKECLDEDLCTVCTALNSTFISGLGCICDQGFYKDKEMNNSVACKPCNNTCKECHTETECSVCTALYSNYIQGACVCNEGYYQAKTMNHFNACLDCLENCWKCENNSSCQACKENYYLINGICYQCGSLLPTFVSAVFLESFVDVRIAFSDPVYRLNCEDLFGKSRIDAEKFGVGYKCEKKTKNILLIQLGTGSSLINETVEISNFFLEHRTDDCKIKIQFQYSAELPSPAASIFAPSNVLMDSEPLKIDGELFSNGGFNAPLEYQWTITSNTSDFQDYAGTSDSSITIPKSKLKEGIIEVKLKVTNKFQLSNSVEKQIFVYKNILIIEFNSVSNYSCKVNQRCEFFIDRIIPFNANDFFEYNWEISQGEKLLVNRIEVLNESSIVIEPNTFKQGTIEFTVKAKNQNGVRGSGKIFVDVITEKPVIMLDRSIGSITSRADLAISASQSINPNLNCSSKDNKDCLKFEWVCYKGQSECGFEYNKTNESLVIPKKFVKNKEFDRFVLTVESTEGIVSKLTIRFDIVDIDLVPIVLIREYFTKTTPSRIPLSQDFVVEAVFDDRKFNEYAKHWVLNPEEHVLSENSVVSVSKNYLKAGAEYKLTFNLWVDDVELNYFYDFTVNNPPKPGQILINPSNGSALLDKFTVIANGWQDPDQDYPLLYEFGYFSDEKRVNLIFKQANTMFSSFLAYIGDPIYVYVQVFDSLGDFTELSKQVSIERSKDSKKLLEKMRDELLTEMNQNIPAIISCVATGIINFEFYDKGKFSSSSSSEIVSLQEAFDLSNEYLDVYISKSLSSKDLVSQVTLILVELTTNPNLKSTENADLNVKTINKLLDKSENLGLDTQQSEVFYEVLQNSFTYSSDLIRNNTRDLNVLTTAYENINKARVKNMYYNQSESVISDNAETQLYGLESYALESSTYSLNNASVTFPSKTSDLNLTHEQKIALSLTYIPLEKSFNFTQNLMLITIFNLETSTQISIKSDTSITIEIPFDQANNQNQTYTCLYFNYSFENWDDQGCFVLNYTPYSIICECNHLSTFTVGIEISFENNAELEPPKDFNFISIEATGFYICVVLYIVYLIFAIFCFFKDKEVLKLNYDIASKRERPEDYEMNLQNALKREVPVGDENKLQHERVPPNDSISLADIDVENSIVENKDNIKDLKSKRAEDQEENKDNTVYTSSNKSENCKNSQKEKKSLYLKKEDEVKDETEIILPTDSINAEFSMKTGKEAFKENFKKLNIYKFTDPNHCRLFRSASNFFELIGGIFSISLFFDKNETSLPFEDTVSNIKNINLISICATYVCLFIIKRVFYKVFKEKDLMSPEVNERNVDKIERCNRIKVIIAVFIYNILMIAFCIEIALIVQNFSSGVNGIFVLNILVNFIIETVISLAKIAMMSFCWSFLKSQIKEFNFFNRPPNHQDEKVLA